jgi:hypothetical protein
VPWFNVTANKEESAHLDAITVRLAAARARDFWRPFSRSSP